MDARDSREILRVEGVSKSYGRQRVADRVSLDVSRGEIVGLLGPNGAGKTTTFRMIVGLIRPEEGKVFLNEREITRLPMYRRARLGVGYLPQESSIFRGLTVEENVLAILETQRLRRKERKGRALELLERLQISHLANQRADSLSGGERRRLEIARALAADPSFMLLDEPFTGIDPKAVAEIQGIVRDLRERTGLGFLITDHQVRETLEITDRSYIIDHGKVLRHGVPAELVNDPEVRRIYLGEQFYMREHLVPGPAPAADSEPEPDTETEAEAGPAEEETVAAVVVREESPDVSSPDDGTAGEPLQKKAEEACPEPDEETAEEPPERAVEEDKDRETIRFSDKGLPISDAARAPAEEPDEEVEDAPSGDQDSAEPEANEDETADAAREPEEGTSGTAKTAGPATEDGQPDGVPAAAGEPEPAETAPIESEMTPDSGESGEKPRSGQDEEAEEEREPRLWEDQGDEEETGAAGEEDREPETTLERGESSEPPELPPDRQP